MIRRYVITLLVGIVILLFVSRQVSADTRGTDVRIGLIDSLIAVDMDAVSYTHLRAHET